jgi:G protein beta subunit-like protein
VWALSEAEDKESTQLHPKNKILAHKKYALSCRFSPDSRYRTLQILHF